jgi:hypothetical protein
LRKPLEYDIARFCIFRGDVIANSQTIVIVLPDEYQPCEVTQENHEDIDERHEYDPAAKPPDFFPNIDFAFSKVTEPDRPSDS